ncbi:DNA translocase FtsK [Thermopetrobacter sp. TC1]|uniref:DNA translocase FtsK n=1 Tax=Thermopetrobacter sp. TC1 TaxID=1495045 RepID=UPI00068ABA34|nr:DNA translocase FtsK [Thermopetrobacter sp. TC1]
MPHTPPAETDDSAVPVALRRFIRLRLMELAGLVLIAAAALLAVALASWSAMDPSLNRAFDVPIRNWLGWPGAVVSDELIMQLGLAVIATVAVPVMWAGRLLSHEPLRRPFARMGWWLVLMLAFAAFLGLLPVPESWPLAAGLGGNLGRALSDLLVAALGLFMKDFAALGLSGILLFALALYALFKAVDVTAEDIVSAAAVLGERNQERIAAGLGGASHWRLSLAAMWRKWRQRRKQTAVAKRTATKSNTPQAVETEAERGPRIQRPATAQPVSHPAPAPVTQAMDAFEDDDPPPVQAFAADSEPQKGRHGTFFGLKTLFARFMGTKGDAAVSETAGTMAPHPPVPGASSARREPRLAPAPAAMPAHALAEQPAVLPHEGQSTLGMSPQPEEQAYAQEPTEPADHVVNVGAPVDEAFLPEELPEDEDVIQAQHVAAPAGAPGAAAAPAAKARPSRPAPAPRKKKGPIKLPPIDILAKPTQDARPPEMSDEALQENARILEGVLEDFGVKGRIINVCPGPVVTLYELEPAPGIKSSRVIGLADDIARSMSAISARVAVVPGRNVIGIELPNPKRETVYLREMLESPAYRKSKFKLTLALGKNIAGEPVFADLARMPHLLIAGTTGSGKSVGINTFIMSLLYRMRPEECRLIMIDPKMLELSVYEGIPHLLSPVVTDPKKAVVALKWAVREMEERYQKMALLGVRNLDGYNARVKEALKKGETITRTVQTGFDPHTGEPVYEEKELELEVLPYIVIIIDEMADLMMVAGKDIEGAVQRLAQMARAAGIHVIMATQRPSVDVITGTIKANFPTRISFQVTSKIDSRTILGEQGAEQLLGQGDMLYMAGGGRIVRLHGPFVSDEEVEEVVNFLKSQGTPEYVAAVTTEEDDTPAAGVSGGTVGKSGDDLYDKAVQIVLRDRKASTSYVQRRLQIGYNKAATLIERMEAEGIISAPNAKGRREILVGGDSAQD